MNERHLPSLLLVTTVGTVLLLDPFAQNFMSSSTPVLIEGNNRSFKTIPDKGTDDDFKDLLNVCLLYTSDAADED